jgi:hypothetical protein
MPRLLFGEIILQGFKGSTTIVWAYVNYLRTYPTQTWIFQALNAIMMQRNLHFAFLGARGKWRVKSANERQSGE